MIVTYQIAWSVCRSVYHSRKPCKYGSTDRDTLWVVDSGGPKEPRIRWGAHWRNLANTYEPFMCAGDAALLSNYFDHLLLFYKCTDYSDAVAKTPVHFT